MVGREFSEAFGTTTRSLENWRKQAALQGPLSLLERNERDTPPTTPILDGDKEARLAKIACSTPPNGRSRWTLQILADELVALEVVESISADTDHPRFANVRRINLVCDNLNTHAMGSLYAASRL
jgi:hypothetical protein